MKLFKTLTVTILLLRSVFPDQAWGQAYRMEVGLACGSSFYMGDANQNALFENTRPSMNLLYRYNLNGRFSVKASTGISGIAGTTTGITEEFPAGEAFRFKRNLLDAGVQMELNFYQFGTPNYVPGSSRITPYISLGVGAVGYKADKLDVSAFIPVGMGIKIKMFERFNVGCEWSFRKTFTDQLDYSDYGGDFQLSDPWLVESAQNKNKDWYSILTLNVSVDLFGTGSKCYK